MFSLDAGHMIAVIYFHCRKAVPSHFVFRFVSRGFFEISNGSHELVLHEKIKAHFTP